MIKNWVLSGLQRIHRARKVLGGIAPPVWADFERNFYTLPSLGPDLMSNGTFNTNTAGWVWIGVGTSVTVSDGVASITGTTSSGLRQVVSGIVIGEAYRVKVRIRRPTGSAGLYLAPFGFLAAMTSPGTTQFTEYEFFGVATSQQIDIGISGTVNGTVLEVDYIEVNRLLLDQPRVAVFSEVFTFARSSTTAASYLGADGVIRNDLPADTPRFDYSTGTRRLLLENASTTLARNSRFQDWSGAVPTGYTAPQPARYQKVVGVVGNNAIRIVGPSANDGNRVGSTVGVLNGSITYTITMRLRKARGTTASLAVAIDGWNGAAAVIDMSSEPLNTWVTKVVSVTPPSNTLGGIGFHTNSTNADIDIDWWQLELGHFATSLIINDTNGSMSRSIETCRFSPIVEAILQRSAATVLVQAALTNNRQNRSRRLVGISGNRAILVAANTGSNGSISSWNGTTELIGAMGSGTVVSDFGAVGAFDGTGRCLVGNGGTVFSDAADIGTRLVAYLARSETIGDGEYGDGRYASLAIWPFRGTNPNLQATASAP